MVKQNPISKQQANRILHRVYRLLEDGEFRVKIKKLWWGQAGEYQPDKNVALINPESEILLTILHEALHALYPDAENDIDSSCSAKVMTLEKEIKEHMSTRQWKNLYLKTAQNILIK